MKACKRSLEDILASIDQSGDLEDALLLLRTFKTVGFHLGMGFTADSIATVCLQHQLPSLTLHVNEYQSLTHYAECFSTKSTQMNNRRGCYESMQ